MLRVDELFDRALEAEFQRMVEGDDQELFLDHCHLTQVGHALIARAVRELLE